VSRVAKDTEREGFRKARASELPASEQERLRNVLRQELAESMVRAVRADPPEIDLTQIDIVLRPGQEVGDWDAVAECSTCSTCGTCSTCSTCGTASAAVDIPLGVARELGLDVSQPQVDVRNLQRGLDQLNQQLSSISRKLEERG
jgi:hypothetical protein